MRLGCDIQTVPALRARGTLLHHRSVLTDDERAYAAAKPDPWPTVAGLFCAKEACIKALADDASGFGFRQLEIRHEPSGRPLLEPRGALRDWLAAERLTFEVSISHSGEYAMAVACLTKVAT